METLRFSNPLTREEQLMVRAEADQALKKKIDLLQTAILNADITAKESLMKTLITAKRARARVLKRAVRR